MDDAIQATLDFIFSEVLDWCATLTQRGHLRSNAKNPRRHSGNRRGHRISLPSRILVVVRRAGCSKPHTFKVDEYI